MRITTKTTGVLMAGALIAALSACTPEPRGPGAPSAPPRTTATVLGPEHVSPLLDGIVQRDGKDLRPERLADGLLAEIEELKEDHNQDLQVEGIVVNQFQARASLPQQMLDELMAEGLPVLPVYLGSSVRMRESHQASQPLVYFDPRHKLTRQFVELHDYLDQKA